MGKINTFKKLKQYARRASLDNFKAIEYESCLLMLLKPKPKYLPWRLWTRIVNLVIKKQNDKKESS